MTIDTNHAALHDWIMPKKYKDIYDQLIKNSNANGECIESTFKKDSRRPPMMTHKGKLIAVHRASWEYHYGKIPEGIFVCHKCDNPKCFRIDHLFLGTPSDNMQDMIQKKRDNIFGARKYSLDRWEKAERLRREGYSYVQIGKMLEMRYEAVSAHMIRHKIPRGEPKPRDKKFPIEIIDKIISLTEDGLHPVEIQYVLGISEATFYRRVRESTVD